MRTVIFLWIILAFLPLEKSVLALTHHATVNGNARGAPCVFPFDLWGAPHHGCSGVYHHSHWCSTTHTYEDDRLWGECPDYDVCDIHNVIDDPWRNVGFTSTFPSWPRTDDALAEGWYRFAGVGGDVLYEGCPSSGAGGTKYPLTLCGGDTHPGPADGVKAMSLCFPDNCQGDEEVNVLACLAGFYLYYLYPTSKSYVTRHRSCNVTVCGVNARCEDGSGGCVCSSGYEIPAGTLPTGDSYGCADIDECAGDSSLCGPNALCSNTNGSFSCVCNKGYQKPPGVTITNATNPCQDVDECSERPDVCGADGSASCSNTMGSFYCTCNEGYIPCKAWNASSPEICKAAADMVDEIFDKVHQGQVLHADGLFRSAESLIAQLVQPTVHHHVTNITTNSTEVQIVSVGPNVSGISHLTITDVTLDIDLHGIAKHYNGSASVALVVYNSMEEVLNASLFHSEDHTVKNTMMSKVVSVISPRTLNNTLPNPVNITLRHLTKAGPGAEPVCVNWRASAWMVESCNASRTNSTHTVCTCEHLSTFALIMQTHDTPKRDPVLELVNMVLVVVGLVFLTLAVLTFALCRFNGRVTNAARLNLCVCLLLAHLLLLLSQRFLHLIQPHKVLCKASAVLQHFLFLCCFLWMSIEALLLFLSVRRLKRVNSHPQAGPHWAFNLLIGYGVPLVIVGVSSSVFPDGYGSQQCWLQVDYGFNWSFLGPVCFILTGNMILFIAILINVHFTLKEARSNISKVKYTRLLLFKIMAQFIILGCPWILGMFLSSSRVLEVLFLLLTSQQGTFIFLVHCLLNDEVWRQYARWWTVCVPSRGHLVSTATSSVSLNKIMSMV